MGIFEDVILNARSAVDTVGKKAGKVIDISKLTLAAADLKAEISKKYEILGRILYESKKTGRDYDKSMEDIIKKIDELHNELTSVNDMIAETKMKTKCPLCGSFNTKGSVYCSKCGQKLPVKKQDEGEEISPDDIVDFTEDNFEDDDMGI